MPEMDLEFVRHALGIARRNGYAEVELATEDGTFSASLVPGSPKSSSGGSTPRTADDTVGRSEVGGVAEAGSGDAEPAKVRATLVGYYREAPTPLRIGQSVRKGDVVAVIAALGLANDVEATVSGEVVEVLVQPDQPVEYGQALALVRPI